jgi:hypothetical protein
VAATVTLAMFALVGWSPAAYLGEAGGGDAPPADPAASGRRNLWAVPSPYAGRAG